MASLKYALRDTKLVFDKRAICMVDDLINAFDVALKENIKMQMYIFAYDGNLYSIGYDNSNGLMYMVGKPDETVDEYNSIESLKSSINFNHEITILREIQTVHMGPMEIDIRTNHVLSNYLITSDSLNYNLNMNDELNNQMIDIQKDAKKQKKENIIAVIGLILFLAIVLTLVTYFNANS